jgi:hypothetical protein
MWKCSFKGYYNTYTLPWHTRGKSCTNNTFTRTYIHLYVHTYIHIAMAYVRKKAARTTHLHAHVHLYAHTHTHTHTWSENIHNTCTLVYMHMYTCMHTHMIKEHTKHTFYVNVDTRQNRKYAMQVLRCDAIQVTHTHTHKCISVSTFFSQA